MFRKRDSGDALRCSFCHKLQGTVGRLISSPSDYPRAYICDECIKVCSVILEEDQRVDPGESVADSGPESDVQHPLLGHPLASDFFAAVERWIHQESLGGDGASELAAVRDLAQRIMRG